jgi:hypothetical protein
VRAVGVVLDAPGLDNDARASKRLANPSMFKRSSRLRPLKDSTKGFSPGASRLDVDRLCSSSRGSSAETGAVEVAG